MAALARRHHLPSSSTDRFLRLLEALASEPGPPTSVTDPHEAAEVHLADSLSGLDVEPLREATSIVDLGAGAGFPGLVLAVALPHARVDLVESSRHKCETIERLRAAAGAANARAIPERAEEWGRGAGAGAYRAATARALAPLAVLCEYAVPVLELGGALVCWKGSRDAGEEAAGARAATEVGLELAEIRPVAPFPASRNRHLHAFVKVAPTPSRFPRRAGMAVKRPLGGGDGR